VRKQSFDSLVLFFEKENASLMQQAFRRRAMANAGTPSLQRRHQEIDRRKPTASASCAGFYGFVGSVGGIGAGGVGL
jgi:hypothetical protein